VPAEPATVVVVAYRTPRLDLGWLPRDVPVVVVHNDDALDRATVAHERTTHVDAGGNIGFGAAVNRAVEHVTTPRVVLVNPDVDLTGEHWCALTSVGGGDVATVPLVDAAGRPTVVVSPYPTAVTHLLGGLRAGRLAPRGSAARARAGRIVPGVARTGRDAGPGSWPLGERWVSGAVMALPVGAFRAVGGFDAGYFLYYEDLDLCARLAGHDPSLRARLLDVAPGRHAVAATSGADAAAADEAARHRLRSACRYAAAQPGATWSLAHSLLTARARWAR
jgi:N-acetylglucosaminyl-diphospho-decaprenol L-rhamnosyltransferase